MLPHGRNCRRGSQRHGRGLRLDQWICSIDKLLLGDGQFRADQVGKCPWGVMVDAEGVGLVLHRTQNHRMEVSWELLEDDGLDCEMRRVVSILGLSRP